MEQIQSTNNVRSSLSPHLFEDIDQRPTIEFNAVAYAIPERQQKVDIIINRTGRIDVIARFRCLHSCISMLSYNITRHNIIYLFIYIIIFLTHYLISKGKYNLEWFV
jgi:hypothetical protein